MDLAKFCLNSVLKNFNPVIFKKYIIKLTSEIFIIIGLHVFEKIRKNCYIVFFCFCVSKKGCSQSIVCLQWREQEKFYKFTSFTKFYELQKFPILQHFVN